MTYNENNQTIIRKSHMEQLHFILKTTRYQRPNIQIIDIINKDTPQGNHR